MGLSGAPFLGGHRLPRWACLLPCRICCVLSGAAVRLAVRAEANPRPYLLPKCREKNRLTAAQSRQHSAQYMSQLEEQVGVAKREGVGWGCGVLVDTLAGRAAPAASELLSSLR